MSAMIETHATTHDRLAINRWGLWLFFASETVLFGAVIASRYFLEGVDTPEEVNQPLGLALTGVLLLSGLTALRAEAAIGRGDHGRFIRNMLVTIVLGILFLVGIGFEWSAAFDDFPPSTGYGTVFFTTTGMHGAHVLSGVLMLVIVAYLGRRPGRFTPENFFAVEGVVKYWNFVDFAWVFIYPTLYLVK